jgi:hypothetical protein
MKKSADFGKVDGSRRGFFGTVTERRGKKRPERRAAA